MLSIMFLLVLAAEAPAATPAAEKPKSQEKMICRVDIETGSLAKRTKLCLTKREWARVREDSELNYNRMNPHLASVPGN